MESTKLNKKIKTIDLTQYEYSENELSYVRNDVEFLDAYSKLEKSYICEDKAVFIFSNKEEKVKVIYKLKSADEIYNSIENNEVVDCSFCCVQGFNMNKISKKKIVKLLAFSSVWLNDNDLSNAIFEESIVDFSYSKFYERTIFENMIFKKSEIYWNWCVFDCESVVLFHCEFLETELSFATSIFIETRIEFLYCILDKGIEFEFSTYIKSSMRFESCSINSNLDFAYATFDSGEFLIEDSNFETSIVNFGECEIDQLKITIKKSSLDELMFTEVEINRDIRFNFEKINRLIFENSLIKADILMDKCSTLQSNQNYIDYKRLSFKNTRVTGNIYIDWEKNNVFNAIENEIKENTEEVDKYYQFENKMFQYRMLKNNYNMIGYYEDEDKALVKFMDNYLELQNKNSKRLLKSFFSNVGEYGTNPLSIFKWSIGIVVFFSIIYSFFDLSKVTNDPMYQTSIEIITANGVIKKELLIYKIANSVDFVNRVFDSLYFSGITFFTIGYGDITPSNPIVKSFTVLEGFLGVFMMSYFSVAIIRKILR